MNRFTRIIAFSVILGFSGSLLLAGTSDEPAARRWHFQLSAFGGFESEASFFHHFRLYSDREMTLWYDNEPAEAWSHADAHFVPGGSVGIGYDLSRVVSLYARFSYVFPVTFRDGVEETIQTFDINDSATYGRIATYAQTDRKAQAFGGSVGAVCTPFSRIPVGMDLELGLWSYAQKFLSETCQKYDSDAVMSGIENRNLLDGRDTGEYLGQGRWRENHLCLMVGLGLKYYPVRWLSADLNWRTLGYLKSESTSLVHRDTGEGVRRSKWYTSASLVSAGLTFYY